MAPLTRRSLLVSSAALAAASLLPGCATAPRAAAVPKKKLLMLGGTGFLGPETVEAALAHGHEVTLFNRGKTHSELFPQLEKLRGDRDGHLEALAGRKWDAVIDTSGYVPRLVKASAELLAPNVGQYVFISSISVYGDTSKVGIDEQSPLRTLPDPTSEKVDQYYGELKALCEQAAEKAMPGRVTSIRSGLIVGPNDPTDRFTYWPARVSLGGEVMAPGDGKDPVQFIDVRDLAQWIVLAIERSTTGVFNAVGPAQPLPMARLLESCKQVSGSDARFTWVSADFLEKQEVSPWSDMPVWVPSTGESAGFATVRSARAQEKGLTFRPLDETVRATLEWWKGQSAERKAKLRAGVTAEREAKVLAAWKASGGKTASAPRPGHPERSEAAARWADQSRQET